jgi:hypothetical protein
VGDLVRMTDQIFEELSRPVAIYKIIFELNQFKFKFELGLHKLHFIKLGEEIHGGTLKVWDPRTYHKLGVYHPRSTHVRRREFDLDLKW